MASLQERMIGAMRGDVKTFEEIEADPSAIGQAVTVIIIGAVAALIGNIFRVGIGGGIASMIMSSSRCCIRWRPLACRREISRRRSAGFCVARATSKYCSAMSIAWRPQIVPFI